MVQILCRDLDIGYDGKRVVEGLSFSVDTGDYLCIVGENGSGKSTLMKTLLGLMSPVSGKVELAEGIKNGEIGYLPQATAVQKDFPASVREIVVSGCLSQSGLRPFYSKGERQKAADNMERLGISDISKKCFRELSGGQQQRVLLARALCAGRQLILLDEPVSGLDPNATADMYDTIQRLNSEEGITVVMISHDIAAAVKYAGRILHIGHKRAMFFGETAEYVKTDAGKIFGNLSGGDGDE